VPAQAPGDAQSAKMDRKKTLLADFIVAEQWAVPGRRLAGFAEPRVFRHTA
jgi:hypothetical protein